MWRKKGAIDSKFDQGRRKFQSMLIPDRHPADIQRAQCPLRLQGREKETDISWTNRVIDLVIHAYIEAFEACRGRMIKKKPQECSAANPSTISKVQMLQASVGADGS